MEIEYDATQHVCPLPLVNTKLTLKTLKPGDCLRILLSDAGSRSDIPAWLSKHHYQFQQRQLKSNVSELVVFIG